MLIIPLSRWHMMATHWQAACENGPQLPHGNCSQSQREGDAEKKKMVVARKRKSCGRQVESVTENRPLLGRKEDELVVALNSCLASCMCTLPEENRLHLSLSQPRLPNNKLFICIDTHFTSLCNTFYLFHARNCHLLAKAPLCTHSNTKGSA